MPKSKTSLSEILYEIRRIEEHRELLTNKKIKKIYQSLMKDLKAFLADSYEKYADSDGRFYFSYLDAQNKRARFLEEISDNCNGISPQIKKEIMTLVDDTYTECYKGMADAVKATDTTNKLALATKDISLRPEVLEQSVNNNISKLTLPAVLEKHRAELIYSIQQELTTSLLNGDRYETTAKRLTQRLDINYNKAMNITRTETHRNVEGGFMDCAEDIQSSFNGSDLIYTATWRTMGDERVRPQQMRKTKKGWKKSYSRNGANHIRMEGVTVKAGDYFDLGNGVKAKAPSHSGSAANDCNCRCFLEYDLMTVEEFENKVGKKLSIQDLKKQYLSSNLGMYETSDKEMFKDALDKGIASQPHGGCVDPKTVDELKDMRTFLSSNNMACVAVVSDGDITAVCKNTGYKARGAVNDMIITARENGGVKMDCYGIDLVNKYERCGYVPVARVDFNEAFAEDAWLKEQKPDIYFMMKNTDDINTVIRKNGKGEYKLSTQEELNKLEHFGKDGYMDAWDYRDNLLKSQENI